MKDEYYDDYLAEDKNPNTKQILIKGMNEMEYHAVMQHLKCFKAKYDATCPVLHYWYINGKRV